MSTSPERHTGRTALIWALKILVSGGLLYVLLTRVDLAHLWLIARTASLPWLAFALFLYFVAILISTWRWSLLLATQEIPVPFGRLVNSYLVATFFNNFLPSTIGGDFVRAVDAKKKGGGSCRSAARLVPDFRR